MNLIIYFFSYYLSLIPTTKPGLYVEVVGLKSSEGKMILGVYKNASTFPTIGKQYKAYECTIKDKKAHIHITDLPNGTYAIGLVHDKNSNNKMDKNMVGYPLEPYGFSNNARAYMSSPKFEEASFYFDGTLRLEIKVE